MWMMITVLNSLFLVFIVYACELDLTQSDLDTVQHIAWKGMAITVLSNDMYSFEVEATLDIQASGKISNGVWHLMKDRDITAGEAKHILLTEKLRPLEEQFLEEKAAFSRAYGKELPQLAHYLDLVELTASGNWYWSSQCYRYHSWRENVTRFGGRPISSFNIQKLDEAASKCDDYINAATHNGQPSKPDEGRAEMSVNDHTMIRTNWNGNPREHQRQYLDKKVPTQEYHAFSQKTGKLTT
jgi:ophiobolin F synthase